MKSTTDWLPGQGDRPPLPGRAAMAIAAFAVAYYALAVFGVGLPLQARFPLFVWPADGLALGAFLVAPRALWIPFSGIAFAASLATGMQAGMGMEASTATALVNALEPAVIATVLLRLSERRTDIASLQGLTAFLVNLVPLSAVVSLGDASVTWWRFGTDFRSQWTVTFVSDFLNMVVAAPLVIAWFRGGLESALAPFRGRLAEVAVLYAGLVLTTHFVFRAPPGGPGFAAPLAYLCSPFLIWAALRFGVRAATLGIVAFALIADWHTAHGLGPYAIPGFAEWTALLQLHGFVAATTVTTLFAAALLAERETAAAATEAWRRRYEAAIRASGNLLYELDPASGTILWDGDTRAVLGAPAEEIATVGQWGERVHPDDLPRLRTVRDRLFAGEVTHIALEHRLRRGEGEWITVGVNGYAIVDPTRRKAGRRIIIGFVSDVSERVRAEAERQALAAQLRQAEKMEAVGRLAGGIAHDFNNILGAILGYGELAQAKAQADPQLKRYVDTIVNAGNRAKALVAQILAYSRAESGIREPVFLGPVLTEVAELLRGSSSGAVEVRLAVPPEQLAVTGDPTRLHQLVMNLASNAIHAMPGGGVLEISLEARTLASPVRTRLSEVAPGEWSVVRVKDSGEGIPAAVIDRIFEPFFTTKPAGRGTGLGLALVHSIVKEHGGAIDVESEVGKGTTFTVWLPRLEEAGLGEAGEEAPLAGRGQVILAVDDEPEVLAALEEMLATLGYEPAGYTDSRAALEAFRAGPGRFEAVISDEVMPGLHGTQLAVELRKANPAIPIVIATGFGGAGFETRAHSAGVNRILRKPYRMQDIGEALRGIFGSA
ncbi:MAG: MASE1 domain-containing protein [Burkholderiales bacterium]|nr:MASE1 domain-containing protein [Burkholderiales bacterium]